MTLVLQTQTSQLILMTLHVKRPFSKTGSTLDGGVCYNRGASHENHGHPAFVLNKQLTH